jgi:hypothetical protein
MEFEVLVPQPNRKTEIPRSCFDDNSRSAFVARMVAKYRTTPASRRFKGVAGTPQHIAVSVAHHGVTSITFHHFDRGGVR